MSFTSKVIIITSCFVMPVLGYIFLVLTLKNIKAFIEKGVIDRGPYRHKPITGDDVVPIARSYKRVSIVFFIFSILFSALSAIILYMRW